MFPVSNKKTDSDDIRPANECTISAINFKNYIETDTGRIEKYFALKNIFDEFNKFPNLVEQELKHYKDCIKKAFDAAIFIHSDGYIIFKCKLDAFPNENKSSAINDLKSSFEKNFHYDSQKEKVIDVFNVKICSLLNEAFKKYDLNELNLGKDDLLLLELKEIFEYVPFNAISYASNTATYIPQLIGELSDIYTKIEYELRKNIRQKAIEKYGLVYNAYYGGKDKHNVFGFEEYPDENGSGIKNLPSLVDTYARLWTRASIEFFLTDAQVGRFNVGLDSYNMNDYDNLFGSLYKECFADACALNSYKSSVVDLLANVAELNEELIAFYISAFLFENRNVSELFPLREPVNLFLVLRFAVTIVCVTQTKIGRKLNFNEDNVASRIKDKVGGFLISDFEMDRELNKISIYIKLVLKRIKEYYNGTNNTTIVDGLRNYIYVQELIIYVNEAMEEGNYVKYPQFTDNDYENVSIILDKWLGCYDRTVRKGKQ